MMAKVGVLLAFAMTTLWVPVASAEPVHQWIAPAECVIDAGLVTQYILTEQQCNALLYPHLPDLSDSGGSSGATASQIRSGGSSGNAVPVVFLPVTATLPKTQMSALDIQSHTIIIDHAKKPRDGMRAIRLLLIIYGILFILLIARRVQRYLKVNKT